VELWAHLVAEHTELVTRAMDLDRVTADAINESQALSDASRVARLQKHGLTLPADVSSMSSSALHYPALRGSSMNANPSYHGSASEHSYSHLGTFPELLAPPSSFSALPSRYLGHAEAVLEREVPPVSFSVMPHRYLGHADAMAGPAALGNSVSASRTLDFSTAPAMQLEAPRPAIYSAEKPRHRLRTDKASRSAWLPVSPRAAKPG